MHYLPIKRALMSVTDKSGLVELAQTLRQGNVELVSTGGTMRQLTQAGIEVLSVSEVTGFPEILGGRVKTLHPRIHAGVLADKDNPEHLQTLEEQGIAPIDLICVNLYDFAGALSRSLSDNELVEEIDIGGPTLLRAGSKNYHSVGVIPSTEHYPRLVQELETQDFRLSLDFRREMAAATFKMISRYDALIARALGNEAEPG
jgi:phosphoribosylaminoimidazolecarboxamide formyltransferase/IMP cyclohydrolase